MFKGVIFDMDGVISDTQKLHSQVESKLLGRFGIIMSPQEITAKYSGVRTKEFFEKLLNKQTEPFSLDDLMNEKWLEMKRLAEEEVDAIKGAIELIKRLKERELPLAVASASNNNYVCQVLKTLKISGSFDTIISGDMVKNGKPDPESFLLAASDLQLRAEECLVIEDGKSGMSAAKNANMLCIGLVQQRSPEYPTKHQVLSLDEITNDYLNGISAIT